MKNLLLLSMTIFTFNIFAQQISVTSISEDTICNHGSINVNYQSTGTFNSGNYFYFQMSDVNGSFANPINFNYINASTSSAASGVLSAWFILGLPAGTGYRVRVASTDPVVYSPANTIDITFYQPDTTVINNGTSLEAATQANGATFQWRECGGPILQGETNATFTPSNTTDFYDVIVSENGCVDTSYCHKIDALAGLDIDNKTFLNVYPNPAQNLITIDTDYKINHLKVVNAIGQDVTNKVTFSALTTNSYQLNIIGLSPGLYFIRTENFTKRVVIER